MGVREWTERTERSKVGAVELPVGTPRYVLCRCRSQVGRVPVGHVEETGGHGILEWLVNIQVESEKIETGELLDLFIIKWLIKWLI